MAEQKSFVFSIVFILIFSAFLTTMPAAFQGQEGTAATLSPIDPTLLTDFASSVDFTRTDFTNYFYTYELGGFRGGVGLLVRNSD
jgi:hypothetical protein